MVQCDRLCLNIKYDGKVGSGTMKLFGVGAFAALLATSASANPWEVSEGSVLLDGTETATYVAGFMFSGKEYEYTSAQINLRCTDKGLVMFVVGDSDLVSRSELQTSPTLEFVSKAGEDLISFEATVESKYDLETARVHEAPGLLEFFRQHDGSKSQVQLPVARTGVPEVRTLSLENVIKTTDLIISTCGPLERWEFMETSTAPQESEAGDAEEKEPMDLQAMISVNAAKLIVEDLLVNQDVTLEQIVEALKPLADAAD